MNTMLTTLTNTGALENITLSNVNQALLTKVSPEMRETTETLLKTMQFSSGVSLAFCAMLYEIKSNTAMLKASPQKSFSTYCEQILRTDKAQASRYCNMYEILFVDIDEPFKTVNEANYTEYTVAQLVAMTGVKDRVIRKLFINEHITADYSCTNINKAVKYLNDFNRNTIDYVKWNSVDELLKNGAVKASETETNTEANTEASEASEANTEASEANTEASENGTKSCKFTTVEEFTKWLKKAEKAKIQLVDITVNYTE